jgi:hypothetical protein
VYRNQPYGRQPTGFGGGPPPPRDIVVLLGIVFCTFSLQFFESTRLLPQLLELTPAVWRYGFIWQLATYAIVGQPAGPIFFLLTLLILFWFGRDVFRALGRQGFWRTITSGVLAASISATLVAFLMSLAGGLPRYAFTLIQGQQILTTVLIAAFATLYGNSTILLFFVLPLKARWFLWLEIVIAFLYALSSGDLPGFVGTCCAVGMTYSMLTVGGLSRAFKQWRLRLTKLILEAKMRRLRSKRGFHVVKKDPEDNDDNVHRGPWIN